MGEGWPSRRKYVTMNVTFFAALAAFGLTVAVVLLYHSGAHTAGDLAKLQKGMTPQEVTAVLGEPRMSVRSAAWRHSASLKT